MSHEVFKFLHSRRMLHTKNATIRQKKIASAHGIKVDEESSHYFHKKHALACGNSGCVICSNPRKIWGEKTIQEKSIEQRALYREEEYYDD